MNPRQRAPTWPLGASNILTTQATVKLYSMQHTMGDQTAYSTNIEPNQRANHKALAHMQNTPATKGLQPNRKPL